MKGITVLELAFIWLDERVNSRNSKPEWTYSRAGGEDNPGMLVKTGTYQGWVEGIIQTTQS